uniref:Uncharacterized protein n=1 Tax=Romanomermis culicivorax TaxID=13658 RepID=A0A915J961_ROMCU
MVSNSGKSTMRFLRPRLQTRLLQFA